MRAGHCRECGTNVWLTPQGGCVNGHPAGSITGAYEAEDPIAAPSRPAHDPKRRRRTTLVVAGVIAALLVACSLLGALVVVPLVGQGTALAEEWQVRLAEDYPGWETANFNVRTFSGEGESQTEYSFMMIPPDRDLAVGVVYVSKGEEPAESCDEVFRKDGAYNDSSEPLLDYLERSYVDAGKSITSVTSDSNGRVTVNWIKESRVGIVSSRVGSFDELEYDEASGTWTLVNTE